MKTTSPSLASPAPKYARLADQLREQIYSGVIKPGDQLPSYAQMQAQYNITQSTLERVYALLEQENLVVRKPNRGTFVKSADRRAGTGAIGLWMDTTMLLPHPFYALLLAGVRDAAAAAETEVVIFHSKSRVDTAKVDGLLLCEHKADQVIKQFPVNLPAVSMLYPASLAASVTSDDYNGAERVMEHLLGLGHRRIAFLSGGYQGWNAIPPKKRLEAYRDTLKAGGIKARPAWVRSLFEPFDLSTTSFEEMGRYRMQQWLAEDWGKLGCTALVAHNDEVAIGAIEVLQEAGISVPGQVSVVGFDGTEIADYYRPRLTTVEVPLREVGAKSVELLLQQIASGHGAVTVRGAAVPPAIVLQTSLRLRESSAAAPDGP